MVPFSFFFEEREQGKTFFVVVVVRKIPDKKIEAIPESLATVKTNFISEPIRAGKHAGVCLVGPAHL